MRLIELFFKKGTEKENKNAKEGMVMGFLGAILLLATNNIYYYTFNEILLSSQTILISILLISLWYSWYLNKRSKKKEG